MPRRDQTPPYEIMRSSARPPSARDAAAKPTEPASPEPASSPPTSPATPTTKAPWWVGSSAPLVLRVPRGLAILIVAGVLVLIFVAYGVGSIRGAAGAKPQAIEPGIGDRPGPSGWFETEAAGYDGPEVEVPEVAFDAERREPGLNYMRLIQSTPEDCRVLAAFFGARGVAIQLVTVNNGRSCIAYAVKRGYRADELGSESCDLYEKQLRTLGRQWKANNGGRGTDLATMYFERYDGPRKPG